MTPTSCGCFEDKQSNGKNVGAGCYCHTTPSWMSVLQSMALCFTTKINLGKTILFFSLYGN